MKFISRDVNKGLLIMLVFFLVLFVVFTLYYQNILRDALMQKSEYSAKLNEITANLVSANISDSERRQEIAMIDKAVLEEKYYNLIAYVQGLEQKKSELESENTIMKSEIEYNKIKVDGPVANFRLIQKKNEEIKNLNNKISELCRQMKRYNSSIDACR